jgi:hypothetical protein
LCDSRAEVIERSLMLRTKAMREKEEQREMRKYRYAVIRIRLPDGILLQVMLFVRKCSTSYVNGIQKSKREQVSRRLVILYNGNSVIHTICLVQSL